MKYPFLIKFSKISNLSDARYAAGMWADFIGFSFDPNDSAYIEPSKASEIIAWVNGPRLVGEFGQQPLEWIIEFSKNLYFDVIEIPQDYKDLGILNQGFKIIVHMKDSIMNPLSEQADLLLVDDMETYNELSQHTTKPLFLALNQLDIDGSQLSGVSFTGHIELIPGTSNQEEWTQFLERHEIED
ncbi:MAG: hypothetical protein IT245_04805 [Bacteroidia bacterium]|nr:hypothetical protein [Bacteroidia bacterium]